MIFECVGAKNGQFAEEALDRENAFELFMRIMSDPQCPARLSSFAYTNQELFSGLDGPTFAAPVTQAATALIAVTAPQRGLDFSAE